MGVLQKSGFWDSIDPTTENPAGDEREYKASQICTPFKYLVTDGVQAGGEYLRVVPAAYDYAIGIKVGLAWIRGRWYLIENDGLGGATELILQHTPPTVYDRIDRVVLRYDENYTLSGRKIYAAIVQGLEAEAPVAPELTRTTEIYEVCLADRLVKPAEPVTLAARITDQRFDGTLCGIADFAPNPGMAPYIAQFQADLQAAADELLANIDTGNIAEMMADIAALQSAMTAVEGRATLLETEQTPITTTGTQPNYSIAVPRLSAGAPLTAGFRQKVKFHAVATADATLAITGAGGYTVAAKNLFQDDDKRARPKKQYAFIEYNGTSFFLVGSGGGEDRLITELITHSSTWAMPAGVKDNLINVRVFGGGGAGYYLSTDGRGGGGGGGHMNAGAYTITPGTNVTVTIGAGGPVGNIPPSAGGVTSFGAYVSASGGAGGGNLGASIATGGAGGAGGGGASWDAGIQTTGGAGSYGGGGGAGLTGITNGSAGGQGGTYGGGGGGGGYSSADGAGGTTTGVGCGAGGKAWSARNGGAGTNTTAMGLEFVGTGAAGTAAALGGAGGGGYGGIGGNSGTTGSRGAGGGGGGYGAKGGDATSGQGGGGGGGYGGAGGNAGASGGAGGGGGYGLYSRGAGIAQGYGAGGHGGSSQLAYAGGVSGICILTYVINVNT